jgi:hypothetical protein
LRARVPADFRQPQRPNSRESAARFRRFVEIVGSASHRLNWPKTRPAFQFGFALKLRAAAAQIVSFEQRLPVLANRLLAL